MVNGKYNPATDNENSVNDIAIIKINEVSYLIFQNFLSILGQVHLLGKMLHDTNLAWI